MLLKNVVFESMSVFAIITLPFRERILGESLFLCFSILLIVICQFILFAYCKSSLKYIPSIFIFSFWSFIVISVGKFVIILVFIGSTVVFSRLIVAPVASFSFWKYFKTFFTDSWFCRKKLESSAYCEIFNCFLEFGIFGPIIVLSLFMFFVVTSPCITYKGSESGQPCLSPLNIFTVSDRNPLLVIMEVLPLYRISVNFI